MKKLLYFSTLYTFFFTRQILIGQDIDGEFPDDNSGRCICPSLTQFLIFFVGFTTLCHSQNNSDFYVAPNGITCKCPDADIGDTGTLTIGGEIKTFTRR